MASKNLILSQEIAQIKVQRIALEIAGQLYGDEAPLIIIGITGSGMVVAENLLASLRPLLQIPVQLIMCNLNKKDPNEVTYSEDVTFTDKNILIVDDVINSGRTLLYALRPLLSSYPRRIQTMALVERKHKNFPVNVDYIGLSVATTLQDHIQVDVEDGRITGAYIL